MKNENRYEKKNLGHFVEMKRDKYNIIINHSASKCHCPYNDECFPYLDNGQNILYRSFSGIK